MCVQHSPFVKDSLVNCPYHRSRSFELLYVHPQIVFCWSNPAIHLSWCLTTIIGWFSWSHTVVVKGRIYGKHNPHPNFYRKQTKNLFYWKLILFYEVLDNIFFLLHHQYSSVFRVPCPTCSTSFRRFTHWKEACVNNCDSELYIIFKVATVLTRHAFIIATK